MILAKKLPSYLLFSLIFSLQLTAAENYVVKLKNLPSIGVALADRLLGADDEFSALDFLGSQMTKTFSFGSFQGFTGNFTSDSLKKLKQHPLVADIVPDMIFDALDGETSYEEPITQFDPLVSLNVSASNSKPDQIDLESVDGYVKELGPQFFRDFIGFKESKSEMKFEHFCYTRSLNSKQAVIEWIPSETQTNVCSIDEGKFSKFESMSDYLYKNYPASAKLLTQILNACSTTFDVFEMCYTSIGKLNITWKVKGGDYHALNYHFHGLETLRILDGNEAIFKQSQSKGLQVLSVDNRATEGHLDFPRHNPMNSPSDFDANVPHAETNGFITQYNAPRHLARLSRKLRLPEHDKEPFNYYYDPKNKAEGVYVYVLDTGIKKDHPEFEGRVIEGGDFTGRGAESDPHGHGTHVAGIIGSRTYGVAKGVTLVEVKSLDFFGNGSLVSVISGVEFAVKHMKEHNAIGVVNLSLGSGKNKVLDDAVESAVESGLVVVAAAGNSNNPACSNSPANSPYAISVGAIDDRTDQLAHFSSYGPCVDIFASGVEVSSLGTKDGQVSKNSGTSMAAPAVTGMVAILLSQGVSPHDVSRRLTEMSTPDQIPKNTLFFKKDTPNKILNNGFPGADDQFIMDTDPSSYNKRAYIEIF